MQDILAVRHFCGHLDYLTWKWKTNHFNLFPGNHPILPRFLGIIIPVYISFVD